MHGGEGIKSLLLFVAASFQRLMKEKKKKQIFDFTSRSTPSSSSFFFLLSSYFLVLPYVWQALLGSLRRKVEMWLIYIKQVRSFIKFLLLNCWIYARAITEAISQRRSKKIMYCKKLFCSVTRLQFWLRRLKKKPAEEISYVEVTFLQLLQWTPSQVFFTSF